MSIDSFFDTREIKTALNRYARHIEGLGETEKFSSERNSNITKLFGFFIREAEYWDEKAQYNIKFLGEGFRDNISIISDEKKDIDYTFAMALRFMLEASLFGSRQSNYMFFKAIQDFAVRNIDEFDDESRNQIRFSLYEMPILIVREFIEHDEVKNYPQFFDALKKAKELQENWVSELDEKTKRVVELNETLKKQESAFNFVGLYAGFAKLGRMKSKELFWSRLAMFGLGFLMPTPLLYEILSSRHIIMSNPGLNDLIKVIPIISITLILIYYFRVALGNYNSVRAQVMQIELRKSLCRFIQSYADYAKELPKENAALLSKFEDVIFSNIMISEEKTPSTFDGIEQLASLLSSIKGGKN
jgi:hypothetical protein